jgi:drug/metabolite transporter (DMT)-like permease
VGCKKVADRFTEIEMVFYTYLVLVIMLTPMVLYYEPGMFAQVPHFTTKTWLGMGSLTLFHNFLSMLLFFKVLKFLDATQVALSNYMITFLGLPIAAIFLGETLSFQSVVGGVLVLIATLILTIVDHRQYKNNLLKLNT